MQLCGAMLFLLLFYCVGACVPVCYEGRPAGRCIPTTSRYLVRYLVERMTSSQSVQFLPLFLVLVLVHFSFSSAIRKKGGWLVVSKSRRCTLVAVKCSLTSDAKRSFFDNQPIPISETQLQLTFPKHTRFMDISFLFSGTAGVSS